MGELVHSSTTPRPRRTHRAAGVAMRYRLLTCRFAVGRTGESPGRRPKPPRQTGASARGNSDLLASICRQRVRPIEKIPASGGRPKVPRGNCGPGAFPLRRKDRHQVRTTTSSTRRFPVSRSCNGDVRLTRIFHQGFASKPMSASGRNIRVKFPVRRGVTCAHPRACVSLPRSRSPATRRRAWRA